MNKIVAKLSAGSQRLKHLAAVIISVILASIDVRDVMTFGGLGLISYGLSSIYPPAAWIVPGAAMFWLGVRS